MLGFEDYGCTISTGSSIADVYACFSSGQRITICLYLKSIMTQQLLSMLTKVEMK